MSRLNRPRFYFVLLFLGIVLTSTGGLSLFEYSSGFNSNLNSISTNIVVGWSPVQQDQIRINDLEIGIVPGTSDNRTSEMIVTLMGYDTTNRTFTFGILTPYDISSPPTFEVGNWTVQSFGKLGSAIYFTKTLPSQLKGDFITGSAVFYFKNLLFQNDHGIYTVYFPFSGGLGYQFQQAWQQARGNHFITLVGSPNIGFYADIPLSDVVVNSFPPFTTISVGIPNVESTVNPARQQALFFPINRSTGVSITYQNPSEVQRNAFYETGGLFSLGVGMPLLISVLMELYKSNRNHGSSSRT